MLALASKVAADLNRKEGHFACDLRGREAGGVLYIPRFRTAQTMGRAAHRVLVVHVAEVGFPTVSVLRDARQTNA